MREGLRSKITYANVMATLAVFLALGGTTLAISLPRKSVGPKQLKKNAVTKKKIRDQAVATEKLADAAVTGPKLADAAVSTPKLGDAAVTASKIDPAAIPFLGTLHPGQTLQGRFNVGGYADTATDNTRQGYSFQFPFPATPLPTVIGLAQPTTAQCPNANPPAAAQGRLCIYVTGTTNLESNTVASENNGAYGFGIKADASAIGNYLASGTWAATAGPASPPP